MRSSAALVHVAAFNAKLGALDHPDLVLYRHCHLGHFRIDKRIMSGVRERLLAFQVAALSSGNRARQSGHRRYAYEAIEGHRATFRVIASS